MRMYLIALMLIFFEDSALAQDKIDRMSAVTMESFIPDTVKWNDEPILPKGAKSAILVLSCISLRLYCVTASL